jgi:hypothetical protein
VKKEVGRMECTLMHKDIEVAEFVVDEDTVNINEIGAIERQEHLPLGVMDLKGGVDRGELTDWLRSRSIPASRSGIWNLYTRLGRNSTEYLILKCHGLSLSDHYWIRPKDSALVWANVNFFHNDFSKDIGEMLFGREPADRSNINLVSPDNTAEGRLRKKWIVADGKRMLVKGGNEPWKQEPYNEVIASAIMRRLGIAHVPYSLLFEGAEPYSLCENFLTTDTEFIPAWRVFHTRMMRNQDTDYSHLLHCCEEMGIPGVRESIDRMLTIDSIIANRDRHYNNFGFVRNATTLAWQGASPLFDNGTSLWHNTNHIGQEVESMPFCKTHEEQIKLVRDLRWFDPGALDGIKEECADILAKSRDIDAERRERIAKAVASRCERIERLREKQAGL